ncbi:MULTISPECIES: NADH:flavin oxidoreductase [Streptomyces]|uniref:NADH:flavin oxidoreductase n=1 Tax=Streptomyces TaxID=1883 RepID=UPI000EF5D1EC|nr:NADH:flavin oxidoreductase [Streptomyces sp. E5N91]WTE23947.1 NADH:flavin oxidoreductase [Streptomyces anthocyanicus]
MHVPSTAPPPATAAPLFGPFTVGSLALENRIVMAPMTRELSPGGVPGPEVAAYYARRARNGVGLIITEGAAIGHPSSERRAAVPRIHSADALAGWTRVTQAVHAAGGRIAAQLMHVGLDPLLWGMTPAEMDAASPAGFELLSPSGVDPSQPAAATVGREMSDVDISSVIDAYARAAAEARQAGFDAIELHAAHGYLIDQFFWAVTNRRKDRYGGDLSARTRFGADVVRACRHAVGEDFPIFLRFSQWKVGHYAARLADSPDELAAVLGPLVQAGVDAFHCSTRRFWQPEFEGSDLNLAGWTKKVTGRPVIAVGSVGLKDSDFLSYLDGKGADVGDVSVVADRLAQGEFDLVAVGRALIADPAWPAKVRGGRSADLIPFDARMLTSLH